MAQSDAAGRMTSAASRPGFVSHYNGARRQDWTTPRAMFDALDAEYHFTLDGASGDDNALLPEARTADDVLVSWAGERVFCNPPWNRIRDFVELAGFADLAVLLVPARVNTRWFHRALDGQGWNPRCKCGSRHYRFVSEEVERAAA